MTPRKQRPGKAPASPPGEGGFSLISGQKLIALYAAMLKCRLLERHIRAERLAALPRSRGREAVAAGVAAQLHAGDRVYAPDGSLLPGFVHKGSAKAVLAELRARRGKMRGVARGKASWDEVLKDARALKRGTSKTAAAVFSGSVPVPLEALRGAATERLPILFVCQHEPGRKSLSAEACRFGLPGIVVDCEDAVAIYRVASEALAHARRGNGPTLIECRRWRVVRGTQTVRGSGAVRAMERYLASKGLWSSRLSEEIAAQCVRELGRAAPSKNDAR
jgi:pyruvate dehydrogenase E1 component alpha subunit